MAPNKNLMAATLTRGEARSAGVLDDRQAVEHITVNSKKQYGFTRKMVPQGLPEEPKLYIYSISEYGAEGADSVNIGAGFPLFQIPPCPKGQEYGEPCVINPIYFFEEAKVDVTEHTFHSGEQIVDAILKIGPGMNAAQDRRKFGWFVSHTNPPTAEEVKRAVTLFTSECIKIVRQGREFISNNRLNEVNEVHRRAAAYLGETIDDKPAPRKKVECVGCSELIPAGTRVHAVPYCGALQNPTPEGWREAIEHGMKRLVDAPAEIQAALKQPRKKKLTMVERAKAEADCDGDPDKLMALHRQWDEEDDN